MSKADFRRRQARRRRHKLTMMSRHLPTFIVLLAITLLVGGGVFTSTGLFWGNSPQGRAALSRQQYPLPRQTLLQEA